MCQSRRNASLGGRRIVAIITAFQAVDGSSILLARSGIMRGIKMNKENVQMVVAVAVLLLLSFVSTASPDSAPEAETAIVVDSVEGTIVENVEPEVTQEVTEEIPEVPDFLESFNEDELEEEFGNVQTGIDLLDNPFQ